MKTRMGMSEGWRTGLTGDGLRSSLAQFFLQNEMQIVATTPTTLEAKQGSQTKMRILGGWFVNERVLPKCASVTFIDADGGTDIQAHIEESAGVGLLDGNLRKKYEGYFQQWFFNLKAALPAQAFRQEDTSVGAELQRVAALHAQGVLNDEEFRAAKGRILGLDQPTPSL